MTFPRSPRPSGSRPRRLRRTPALRALVRETQVRPSELILPVFVKEGIAEPEPIASMPGVVQHTTESLRKAVSEAAARGVGGFILFGIPATKDPVGSQAHAPDGISQQGLQVLRDEVGEDRLVIADLCLCEYTDHAHCGVLDDRQEVDNDATVAIYARTAVAQAEAGAQVVAPSGMQDGQVAAIRAALDEAGHAEVAILAYAAKFASSFYGPFRDAAECAPAFGDRRGYQMDPANLDEAVREVEADIAEGADMVMVKPAMPSLDVIHAATQATRFPMAAYQVSGEYAMLKAAAANGWLDERSAVLESLLAIRRAGASAIVTYAAADAAAWLADA